MAARTVFKIFGSVGPAGAIVSLSEKMCANIFPHAYKFGDENQFDSAIDKEIKAVREEYI